MDDLLDVGRFKEGRIELRLAQVDLAGAMHVAVEGSGPRISAARHRLVISVPSEPVLVEADPTRLSQIMQNLLNNAAKYTPPGRDIWFSGHRDENEAIIVVRDSGIGIPAEDLPSIFGLFQQLPGGKQYSQGGLGVGLALVRLLTQLHGGTVSAHSAGVGQGSEFIVRLPLSVALPAHVDVPPAPAFRSRARRILVVDDNADAAESLAMLLELEGNTVWRALDAKAALQVAREQEFDVALLDIGLQDMCGYELANRMRAVIHGTPLLLIAITGWGQQEDLRKAKAAGFDFHFTKPVDVVQLLAAISTRC